METQEHRGRSSSASHMSNHRIRHSASPSPHSFPNPSQPDYLFTAGHQTFTPGDFPPNGLDSNLSFDIQGQINGTSQSQPFPSPYILQSNDYEGAGLNDTTFDANGMNLDKPSDLKLHTSGNQLGQDFLDPNSIGNFGDISTQQQFENPFSLEQNLQNSIQNHQSINPADIMNSNSSPHNLMPTPSNLIPTDHLSPTQNSPGSAKPHFSPRHSRQSSLEPSSATFQNGQAPQDWGGLQFRTHRRAPSEYSDVSSSLAPSPNLAQQDNFDHTFDQNPSPLINAQQDQMYQDALGIESFSLSDPQQSPHHPGSQHISPRHSPFVSPRMTAQSGYGIPPEQNFVLPSNDFQGNLGGGPGPEIYTGNPNQFAPQMVRHESTNDMGQADLMAPPEINVELAPPSKNSQFGPMSENDFEALSPPIARSMSTLCL